MIKIKLGEVMDVKRGMSLSGEFYSETGDKIRLTLGNFNYPSCGFKHNTSKKDIYFTGNVRSEFVLKKGDIITPLTEQVRGLLGNTATIPEDDLYIQSGDIGLVIPNEKKLDKRFAYYLVSSPVVKAQLDAGSQQTKIRHTSPDAIKTCEAWLPESLDTQKRIANILDDINNKIENNNAINAELEAMAKTIYDYWFLQFEFPDENGTPYKSSGGKMVWNEELKKEVPEGWEVDKIGNLFDSQAGYAFKSENWTSCGHPVLTIKSIDTDGCVNLHEASFIETYLPELQKYAVSNGNMIFAMSGNTIGKLGIIASSIENILINQRVLILKTSTKDIAFPYFLIKDKKVQNIIFKLGTNSAQPNISEDALRNIKVLLPSMPLIKKYNMFVSDFFATIIHNRIENQELASLRDFLLPLLMNGQVGFKENEE